jgi:hypothetical protein
MMQLPASPLASERTVPDIIIQLTGCCSDMTTPSSLIQSKLCNRQNGIMLVEGRTGDGWEAAP